jgi:hypothetical protein
VVQSGQDAFHTKCADYRNRGILLSDMAFLAILEIGGVDDGRANEAMIAFRRGEDRSDVLRVLTATSREPKKKAPY